MGIMKLRLLIFSLLCFIAARADVVDNQIVKTNLTVRGSGVINNLQLNGTTVYGGAGSNDLSAGALYVLGLRGSNGQGVSVYPTAHTVNSIADLMATPTTLTTTNATVSVRGYYAAGDGGGGTFYYAPFSATNRGMIFQAGSASFVWKRVWGGEAINVRWFGAKGDGVTDDTAAVQAAIDFAESPSYGPGSDGANENTAPVEFVAGEYVLSQIVVNKLSELRGIAGQKSDINNGTVIKQKAGFVGPLISVTPAGSAWSFRKPYLHDFALLGQAEQNATNHVAITAATSRLSFSVATNSLPEYNAAALTWPFFGHCFFYGPADGGTRRYMGSGWVQSIDYTNGTVTLRGQTDWYATPLTNGLSLGTNMAVIFSPLRTNGTWVGYSGAYAPAGNAAIWIEGSGNSRIENVNIEKFHCGIVTAANTAFIPLANFFIGRSQFFNLGAYRSGLNSDAMVSVGYLQGFYRTDYALPTATLAVTNTLYRRTAFNLFNPGYADDYSQVTFDSALVNHFQAISTDVQLSDGLNDNATVGAIWLDGINSMTNAFRYSGKTIRSPFLTSPSTEGSFVLNTTNATYVLRSTSSAFANATFDVLSVHGVYPYLNNDTNASPAPKFGFGFILPSASYVNIGVLDDIQGITTIKSGAGRVNWGAVRNEVTSASDADGNWYFPSSTSIAYAPATTELFRINSTGVALGYSTMTDTPLAITGSASGAPWVSFTRSSGANQTYSFRGADNIFRLYDDTAAVNALYVVSTASGRQLYIGSGAGSATPAANADLLAERGSGSNVAGSPLALVGDYSTGNANASVAVRLRYGVAGSSGSTLQSLADGLVLEGDGDVTIPTTGSTLTLGGRLELGHATDTTLARSAAGVVTIEGVTIAERPTTTALTYSGTNVTLTATSHVLHGSTLTLTNNCLLTITSSDGASGGITIVPDSSTSYTVYLASGIKLLGGGSSFVVTNSASETVNLEWKQTLRGGSSVILANRAVYP